MPHDRAYLRAKSWSHAIRKRKLDKEITPYSNGEELYDNLHQYSKNKIHCSCAMCVAKTKNKGHRRTKSGNYAPSINWAISDKRQIERLKEEFLDEGVD